MLIAQWPSSWVITVRPHTCSLSDVPSRASCAPKCCPSVSTDRAPKHEPQSHEAPGQYHTSTGAALRPYARSVSVTIARVSSKSSKARAAPSSATRREPVVTTSASGHAALHTSGRTGERNGTSSGSVRPGSRATAKRHAPRASAAPASTTTRSAPVTLTGTSSVKPPDSSALVRAITLVPR